jgi:hypothetical protein
MSRLKEQAEALAECLWLGIVDTTRVAAWADEWIRGSDAPMGVICDLALASSETVGEVVDRLHGIPGSASTDTVRSLICALLKNEWSERRLTDEQVGQSLCRMGIHSIDREGIRWSGCFHDELDEKNGAAIVRGFHGRSRGDVLKQMSRVLDALSDGADWIPTEAGSP